MCNWCNNFRLLYIGELEFFIGIYLDVVKWFVLDILIKIFINSRIVMVIGIMGGVDW